MERVFEWDELKSLRNWRRHGVSFDEAVSALRDPMSSTIDDPSHSQFDERFITLGRSMLGRFLVVSHTDRGIRVRLISARRATRRERRDYEEEDR